jgi:hypothetical protein
VTSFIVNLGQLRVDGKWSSSPSLVVRATPIDELGVNIRVTPSSLLERTVGADVGIQLS